MSSIIYDKDLPKDQVEKFAFTCYLAAHNLDCKHEVDLFEISKCIKSMFKCLKLDDWSKKCFVGDITRAKCLSKLKTIDNYEFALLVMLGKVPFVDCL
jgi:hypothetical protein